MNFRESIEARGLISGRKQVMVHLIRDDPMYLEIPKGFFEFILVVRGDVVITSPALPHPSSRCLKKLAVSK